MIIESSSRLPKCVERVGMYYHRAGTVPDFRTIPAGEEYVELMLGGRAWVRHAGGLAELGAGHLLWHIAGDETICRSDPTDPYFCLSVSFETSKARRRRHLPHLSCWPDLVSVRQFADQSIHWFVNETVDREGLLYFLYGTLMIHAGQRVGDAARGSLPAATQQVLTELETHYASPRPLREIAQGVGWSLSHLHAAFKAQVGVTPHEIVQRCRLRAAKELLASSDMRMKEVADACGYSNAAAFCHAFRQRVGDTPRAWRLRQLGLKP
jgi:AraC-like DNA-binding protein